MQNLTELFPCLSETDEGYDTFRYEEELKARYGLLEGDSSEEDERPVNKKVQLIIRWVTYSLFRVPFQVF